MVSEYATVDLRIRHYANWGGGKKKSKRLAAAKQEYKDNANKARKTVFQYNYDGIAKHGKAWVHMNRTEREAWFKRMLASNETVPEEAMLWAKERGLV